MQQSMFSWEAPPASPSRSLDFAKAWLTQGGTSPSSILQSLTAIAPSGSFGRMSPASCHRTKDEILEPLSEGWSNSGIMRDGECLTLNTSEWTDLDGLSLKDEGVCSLSDILETGAVPQRYFLSAKACKGILRRAAKRGKELPPQLARALQAVADPGQTSTTMAG
jgi:hypothetical protein